MNEEQISAMVDDELDAASLALIEQMHPESALVGQWSDYNLISDVLRGTEPCAFDMGRFRARLAAEPTVLCRPSRISPATAARPERRWVYRGLSVAAGLAGILVVGSLAMPRFVGPLSGEGSRAMQSSPAPAPALLGSQSGSSSGAAGELGTLAINAGVTPTASGMQDYLLAHHPFSGSYQSRGVSPYVRPVSDANNGTLAR